MFQPSYSKYGHTSRNTSYKPIWQVAFEQNQKPIKVVYRNKPNARAPLPI